MQRQEICRQLQILPVSLACSVKPIADYGVSQASQVPAYLMFAPGLYAYVYERVLAIANHFLQGELADRIFSVNRFIDS
jgi:hypothetical protein